MSEGQEAGPGVPGSSRRHGCQRGEGPLEPPLEPHWSRVLWLLTVPPFPTYFPRALPGIGVCGLGDRRGIVAALGHLCGPACCGVGPHPDMLLFFS